MILLIVICIGVISCDKDLADGSDYYDDYDGAYCVNTIKSSPASTILPESEMETIRRLFDRNQMDHTKYLFYRLQKSETGQYHVRGWQFANNLSVFQSDVIFHFDPSGEYSSLSGHLVSDINLDAKPRMKRDEVIEKFIDEARQDRYLYMQDVSPENLKDCCFDIEFGYYDLNGGIPNTDENYIKAWKVQLSEGGYPFAYVNDGNGGIVYYFNGVIIG
jgi:Zn-dependent metalloprotease